MLGLDVIGASQSSATASKADKVASKAKSVLAKAGKSKKIAAYAKKAANRAAKAKDQLAKAAKTIKKAAKKPGAKAPTPAMAPRGRGVAPSAPAPALARGRITSRMLGDDEGSGSTSSGPMMTVQAIDPAIWRQLMAEMAAYDGILDDAAMILALTKDLEQWLPTVQSKGLTDLYNQGQGLLAEAYNYDPEQPTDLAARGAQWILAARSAGVDKPSQAVDTPPPPPPPADTGGGGGDYGGGGGDYGDAGGGGGGAAPATADDGGEYDPEGDSAREAAEVEDQGMDDAGTAAEDEGEVSPEDEGGDEEQVTGLVGLDIFVGYSPPDTHWYTIATPGDILTEMDNVLREGTTLDHDIAAYAAHDADFVSFHSAWSDFWASYNKFYQDNKGWFSRLSSSTGDHVVAYGNQLNDWRTKFKHFGGVVSEPEVTPVSRRVDPNKFNWTPVVIGAIAVVGLFGGGYALSKMGVFAGMFKKKAAA